TTLVTDVDVSKKTSPYDGRNPPPNRGEGFDPPIADGLPTPPRVSQIIKKDRVIEQWFDDNSRVWPKSIVTWDMLDHDVAVINSRTLDLSYISGLMNLDMHISTRWDGMLLVIGTEATNHIRFEPNLRGHFVHSMAALIDPAHPADRRLIDLNPHLRN